MYSRKSTLFGVGAVGGAVVTPVLALVYAVGLGTLCAISLLASLFARYFRSRNQENLFILRMHMLGFNGTYRAGVTNTCAIPERFPCFR